MSEAFHSIFVLFLALILACDQFFPTTADASARSIKSGNTDLVKDQDDALLFLSTLDGSIFAVSQKTGQMRWKFKDEPVVKVPLDKAKAIVPLFLPDPKDGSLYLLGDREALKKLPFTIPQLVASSPCRSSDGILYNGKKTDTWFSVDPKTGAKRQILSFDKIDQTCPAMSSDSIFIGRTEYNIMMYDSKTRERHWNITFYEYSSTIMESESVNNYDLVHFTASSSGRALTLDRRLGNALWEQDYSSPVIAMYLLQADGLLSVPFTSVADETLNHLVSQYSTEAYTSGIRPADMKLFPTLYIGEHGHGLYAFPSLVDQNTVTISSMIRHPYLLEGPGLEKAPSPGTSDTYQGFLLPGQNFQITDHIMDSPLTFQSLPKADGSREPPIVILGHYKVPEYTMTQLRITGQSSLVSREPTVDPNQTKTKPDSVIVPAEKQTSNVGVQTEEVDYWDKVLRFEVLSKYFFSDLYHAAVNWLSSQENKMLKLTLIVAVGFIFSMLWYLNLQVREFRQMSQLSNTSQNTSIGTSEVPSPPSSRSTTSTVSATPSRSSSRSAGHGSEFVSQSEFEEVEDNSVVIRVGKITFSIDQLLGKGCEGTFVYKGEFDSRAVAVKRLLPECFTFADREVALLRESDAHPNVIRYYCTEQDKQFRYIALELCAATLKDYVERTYVCDKITALDILAQSTAGLAHLHSLDIVHRDIKPHNVLMSWPNARGEVRVMISDFGLCKKLQLGRMSFSRRSGVTGTDGWIAPEMVNGSSSTTCLVDIFSLGCVFYYVLTNGSHPFGDMFKRQANILSGDTKLRHLDKATSVLPGCLILAMLSTDPFRRPPADAVLKHPLFWDKTKVLNFFLDVSDRVEKDDNSSVLLHSLETDAEMVVGDDWLSAIDKDVEIELRKFRGYNGRRVRDLLRALRNKKHHYREQSEVVQQNLGEIPDKFVDYWLSRFPYLLFHAWLVLQTIKEELIFSPYYSTQYQYSFNVPLGTYSPDSWLDALARKTGVRKKNSPSDGRRPFEENRDVDGQGADGFKVVNRKYEGDGDWRKPTQVTMVDLLDGVKRTKLKSKKKKKTVEVPLSWRLPPQ